MAEVQPCPFLVAAGLPVRLSLVDVNHPTPLALGLLISPVAHSLLFLTMSPALSLSVTDFLMTASRAYRDRGTHPILPTRTSSYAFC